MKFNQELSLLEELSDQDQELISGGATIYSSSTSTGSSSSSSSSGSFTTIDGITTGSGRISSSRTVDGVVVEQDDQSFSFGPLRGSFSFSTPNSRPSRFSFRSN